MLVIDSLALDNLPLAYLIVFGAAMVAVIVAVPGVRWLSFRFGLVFVPYLFHFLKRFIHPFFLFCLDAFFNICFSMWA